MQRRFQLTNGKGRLGGYILLDGLGLVRRRVEWLGWRRDGSLTSLVHLRVDCLVFYEDDVMSCQAIIFLPLEGVVDHQTVVWACLFGKSFSVRTTKCSRAASHGGVQLPRVGLLGRVALAA